MAASNLHRQDNQPVYVLHTYPFKETSLVVELFSREFGRVAAVARGARRPRSAMRGMLQAFQPLQATWSGKAELKNLHGMEWGAGLLLLRGEALMCGFYLNELLLRLLLREDGHDALFDYYSQTLRILAQDQVLPATTLRRFELKMLQELGYAVPLEHDASGEAIQSGHQYVYVAEQGALRSSQHAAQANGVQLSGKALLDMAQDDYTDTQTQQQSKQLMRALLAHYLGEKPLHTRQLLMDLQAL
ncbi:DNA repair protein RecO [Methylobacillus arboreus]|uniref:DNA repair protein RecO n=1 Tax=Methylobacillus arboreus TaxID=755170 RepID=UPI001E2F3AC2|nr:DNA repair protein RecO [Methylobacillus arboreus]MCB5191684.1 DNA repair protein RecO [Methylobacillus arboreus]